MSNIINLFTAAAKDEPLRDSVKINNGYWELTIKGKAKWKATCDACFVPSYSNFSEDGDTLAVAWISYADQIFGYGGIMEQALPGYEPRKGQLQMARTIQRAIEMGEPAVIEAGTGTGKSFAYLAICMAMNKRVVVATSNKALQMQLYTKDVPFLQKLFPDKKLALAQGKSNYACLENCKDGVSDQRFYEWLQTTDTGSVEELTFDLHDVNKYTVDDECTGKRCDYYANCYYFKEKDKREEADVIICNHSLLALNHKFPMAKILPNVDVVVIDEAHQLPNYARNALGLEHHAGKVRKALKRIWDKDMVHVGKAEDLLLSFEHEVVQFVSQFGDKQISVPDGHTFACGIELVDELRSVAKEVFPADDDVIDSEDRKRQRRATALRTLASDIKQICEKTQDGHVRWIDVEVPTIVDAPFDISGFVRSMVENYFYKETSTDDPDGINDGSELEKPDSKPVYIFTSATLATPKLSNFMHECGIDHGFQLIAESPFDYESNTLLYVPNGATPPPNNNDYTAYMIDEVKRIVFAAKGGAFLLFTSWKNMNACLEALEDTFKPHYPIYVQGRLPKMEIARRFKEDGNAILFATKSFWEGVDIPGEALRAVVIDKMPFQAPTPLFSAREAQSSSSFAQVMLPEMIIDLKQGVGRLVRRSTDRGVIAILDSRLRSKPYGRNLVLKSLPPAKLIHSTAMISEFFAQNSKVDFPNLAKSVDLPSTEVEDFTLVFQE